LKSAEKIISVDKTGDGDLSHNTEYLTKLTIALPILILFCSCGTVIANECRINPYATEARRTGTAIILYSLTFITMMGATGTIIWWGLLSYQDFVSTRALVKEFTKLKSCSDMVLDKAGDKGDELEASESRLYLIAMLSVAIAVLICTLYIVLGVLPCCCKSKEDPKNAIVVENKQIFGKINQLKDKKTKAKRMNESSDPDQ
jgi:hypothetical protein